VADFKQARAFAAWPNIEQLTPPLANMPATRYQVSRLGPAQVCAESFDHTVQRSRISELVSAESSS